MKKIRMIGTAVAFVLIMGMPAFAANAGYRDNGDRHWRTCNYVDADGDGICDNAGEYCPNNAAATGNAAGRSSYCGNRGNCRR